MPHLRPGSRIQEPFKWSLLSLTGRSPAWASSAGYCGSDSGQSRGATRPCRGQEPSTAEKEDIGESRLVSSEDQEQSGQGRLESRAKALQCGSRPPCQKILGAVTGQPWAPPQASSTWLWWVGPKVLIVTGPRLTCTLRLQTLSQELELSALCPESDSLWDKVCGYSSLCLSLPFKIWTVLIL